MICFHDPKLQYQVGYVLLLYRFLSVHSTGILELKSIMLRIGVGNLAEMCCTVIFIDERFERRSCIRFEVENCPF